MSNRTPVNFLLVALALLSFLMAAPAQSGRKVRKPATPPPVATPEPASPLPTPAEKTKPSLTLVVGMQRTNLFDNARIYNASGALHTVVDRLEDHSGVKVVQVRGDMSRAEAVRRAKAEKEAYVVLLELSYDRMAGSSEGQLRLLYWVFSPITAKIKTSGQTYPHMYRTRGVILDPRGPDIYGDRQLQEAARDAADRVLRAFQLHTAEPRRVL